MNANLKIDVEKGRIHEGEVVVRFYNGALGGFYAAYYLTIENANDLRDKLNAILEPIVEVPVEVLSKWQCKDVIRNPLMLNEDALAENDTQADGFKDAAFVMGEEHPNA